MWWQIQTKMPHYWLVKFPLYTNTNKKTRTNTNRCKCRNTEMKIWTIESSILCFLRQLPRLWPCPPYKPHNACWPYNAHTPPASKCLVFPFSTFHISYVSYFHIWHVLYFQYHCQIVFVSQFFCNWHVDGDHLVTKPPMGPSWFPPVELPQYTYSNPQQTC